MKKLLLITLIIPFISLAQEDEQTDTKQNVCIADPTDIIKNGLAPCKAGDLLFNVRKDTNYSKNNNDYYKITMRRICVLETYDSYCILKAEEDFLGVVKH